MFQFAMECLLLQKNGNDCGLGSVANSLVVVQELKDKKFLKSKMMEVEDSPGCYQLDRTYNLLPFWDCMLRAGRSGPEVLFYQGSPPYSSPLHAFRMEYFVIVDRLSKLCCKNK